MVKEKFTTIRVARTLRNLLRQHRIETGEGANTALENATGETEAATFLECAPDLLNSEVMPDQPASGNRSFKGKTMASIETRFNSHFKYCEIELPADTVANRRRGEIVQRGWTIWYLVGSDKEGEYLDYYASHRMAGDRHVRLHTNGAETWLPAYEEMRITSDDPQEDEQLENEFWEFNGRVTQELEAKGFTSESNTHPSTALNHALLRSRESHQKLMGEAITKEKD